MFSWLKVEATLSAYPGPVTLHQSAKSAYVAIAVIGVTTIAAMLMVYPGFGDDIEGFDRGTQKFLGVFWTVASLFTILVIARRFTEPASMTLDGKGFVVVHGYRNEWEWTGVEDIRLFGFGSTPLVVFNLVGEPERDDDEYDNRIDARFGMSSEGLASLLRRWREKALADR